MKQVLLDFRQAQSAGEIHRILSRELHFPSYYGANLDALWDCLSELPWGEEGNSVTVLLPGDGAAYPPYLDRVLKTLLEASETFSQPDIQNKGEVLGFLQKESFGEAPRCAENLTDYLD